MKVNFKAKKEVIQVGDIVEYRGDICMIARDSFGEDCLIDLKNSEVMEIDNDYGMSLIAKCNEVVLQKINGGGYIE